MAVSKVSNNTGNEKNKRAPRLEYITVKQGNTLTSIAKNFGMSVSEFKDWTGLKKNSLIIGQEIKLPTAKAIDGKGIYAIAREYGMTMAEFAKLNNIKNPNEYNVLKDEVFYVKPKKDKEIKPDQNQKPKESSKTPEKQKPKAVEPKKQQTTPAPQKQIQKNSPEGSQETAPGAALGGVLSSVIQNKRIWGSSYTPEELGSKIYELSCKYRGAVGKPDFDALIDEINPKNASAVIDAYPKNKENEDQESLLHTILREVKSSKQSRKDASMKVYDALAKEKNVPASKREEFEKELDNQLNGWGLVNTKKLDGILNEIIKGTEGSDSTQESSEPAAPSKGAKPSSQSNPANTNDSHTKDFLWNPTQEYLNRKTAIRRKDGTYFTVRELHDGAVAGAKRDPAFKAVAPNRRYTPRPYPNINEHGQIEATCEVRQSKNPNGPLKGKVVIINSGHGGYSPSNGFFDAGTVLSVKNAEGHEMPVEEWRTADMYAEDLVGKLQAKGATVVFVNGAVRNGGMGSTAYLENMLAGKKGPAEVKNLFKNTKKSDIAFMSIHVESAKEKPSDRACTVRAYPSDKGDDTLAKKINTNVGKSIKILQPQIAYNNYYVTRAMGSQIPAVLVELGNIANKDVKASLLSSNDRGKYTDALAQAIEETLLHK